MKELQDAFTMLHDRYKKILENYYPAHGSVGFTERNLTHNFAISLENVLGSSSICWFEAPISIKPKKHIDAIVFDLNQKRTFLIESKRFSNPEQKIEEAKKDIERMKDQNHISLLERNLHGIKIKERYAVLLADVWKENDRKREIYGSWPCDLYPGAFFSMKTGINGIENYSLLILAVKL